MAFKYHIRTGHLEHPEVGLFAVGYSGKGRGLNNPDLVGDHGDGPDDVDAGPIPPGRYTWSETEDSHGGFAIILVPDPANEMHGRGNFLIHGDLADAARRPQQASLGCIIIPRVYRWAIWGCDDTELEVVAE